MKAKTKVKAGGLTQDSYEILNFSAPIRAGRGLTKAPL